MDAAEHDRRQHGLAAGVAAYVLWGLLPLFWPLLQPAGALEVLAQRIWWSMVAVLLALLALRTKWGWIRAAMRGAHGRMMVAAALLVGVNWLTYIWAVNNGHVVETSLGYFINPLVNVVLGVLLFGERLSAGARIGGLLALAGVAVIAVGNAPTLWISLLLAGSFALYGVVKKKAHLPALRGLLLESALLLPLALPYLVFLEVTGRGHGAVSPGLTALFILSGVVTAVPLWLFAVAAPRLPFGIVGVLQYVAPTIQFLLGVAVFREHVTVSYWIGLVLVWCGSAVYLWFTLRRPVHA